MEESQIVVKEEGKRVSLFEASRQRRHWMSFDDNIHPSDTMSCGDYD